MAGIDLQSPHGGTRPGFVSAVARQPPRREGLGGRSRLASTPAEPLQIVGARRADIARQRDLRRRYVLPDDEQREREAWLDTLRFPPF
jgi:hypothetical protein